MGCLWTWQADTQICIIGQTDRQANRHIDMSSQSDRQTHVSTNLIDAVLGQLNTILISPKNLPEPIVSNTIGVSCSDTTST